ncbi:hypothetical protein PSV08DRAFT_385856 [Bipolaris maydis]|uniref:uncharacterized protein n=1 Tax=Cochliobolus heterostrophus TaxID=5016 RepID=UPI0024DBCD12|nr:hypothetical protein J3E73DRAFT_396840 [Bipolaris maydis]KAJ6273363.1 hypothetical protein PSV08DRAFT_385856 [Bipolaris maydis]KAJ6284576.1 hypothetical protein J3E71DRAFT_375669 [Bipolaris maydis]
MPRRLKINTPPPELQPLEEQADGQRPQVQTPKRAAIFAVYLWAQQQSIPCNLASISTLFGIPKSTASDILASRRCRRLQNADDVVDTRPPPRQLTRSDTAAIGTWLDEAPFDDKSLPWQDISEKAGVVKDTGAIQRRVAHDEGIKSHKAVVKGKHKQAQINSRLEYCSIQLQQRPTSTAWRDVIWCDEIHWMTGPKYLNHIKRRPGVKHREDPKNIQYEEQRKVDPDLQIYFHIWCVVGYNFKFAIPYNAGNSNGKMTAKIYTTVILPALQAHLLERGGEYILWQDRDSAHISKKTLEYMDHHGMGYILSPPKSPDMSIMETWVAPIRRKFYMRRCATQREGVQRFYKVLDSVEQEKINKTVDQYPHRLQNIVDIYHGRASKY